MYKKKTRRRLAAGALLIETLFAMVLIFTAATIVFATMPVATVSKFKARYNDKAMDLAQKQMEAIKSLGFSNATPSQLLSRGLIDTTTPVSTNTYPFTNSDSTNLDNPGLVLPSGTGTITLNTINIDLVQIIVTITWSDHGTPESYTIGSEVALL